MLSQRNIYHYLISVITLMLLVLKSSGETLQNKRPELCYLCPQKIFTGPFFNLLFSAHASTLHPPLCHFAVPKQCDDPCLEGEVIHMSLHSLAAGRLCWLSQSNERLCPAAGTHLQAQQEGRGPTLCTFHVGLCQI